MKRIIPVVLVAGLSIVACSSGNQETANVDNEAQTETLAAADPAKEKWETTASGLKYQVLSKNKQGAQAQKGDYVSVHYTGTLTDGTKFDSSVDRGAPFNFPLGMGRVIKGWDEGVALMRTGEKFKFHIPANLAYGERSPSPVIPPNSDLIFEVELLGTVSAFEDKPFDVSNVEPEKTASGLTVYRMNTTEGQQAVKGKVVSVHYIGYLDDGTIFDSSIARGMPIDFPLGQGRVIKGWDEGISMLKVGEEARLVIPSQLGYGSAPAGGGKIPANSTLTFDVKLMGVQ